MSRIKLMANRQCSRCTRVEQQEVTLEQAASLAKKTEEPSALVVSVNGETAIDFSTLCEPCRRIIARYLQQIGKKLTQQSSFVEKKRKKKSPEDGGQKEKSWGGSSPTTSRA